MGKGGCADIFRRGHIFVQFFGEHFHEPEVRRPGDIGGIMLYDLAPVSLLSDDLDDRAHQGLGLQRGFIVRG